MRSLRDAAKEFARLKVRVFGISLDNETAQKRFWKAEKLNFDLLCDTSATVAKGYRALMKGRNFTKRITFIIDPKGVIRAIVTRVKVKSHGKDLVEQIKKLQKK